MSDDHAANRIPGAAPRYAFHAVGSALVWDYVRATATLAIMVVIWSAATPGTFAWAATGLLSLAFIFYLGQTLWRHGLRIELDEDGASFGWRNPLDPVGMILLGKKRLDWSDLSDVKLRYFSRKPKSEQTGWMMVQLKGRDANGGKVSLTFDGTHEAFQPVLQEAWSHAMRRGLPIDEPTLANLEATGIGPTEGDLWTS